jgi:hypothetical protein
MEQPKFNVGDVVHFINDYGVYWGTWLVTGVERVSYSSSGFGYHLDGSDTPWHPHKEESLFLVGHEAGAVFSEMVKAAREYYCNPECVRIGVEDSQSRLTVAASAGLFDSLRAAVPIDKWQFYRTQWWNVFYPEGQAA